MKKVLTLFVLCFMFVGLYGQGKKITELPVVTSTVDASLLMVRSGASGNTISQTTKANFLTEYTKTADGVDISTVVKQQADTVTITTWSVGIGAAGDTANFRTFATHGYTYGAFFWDGSDTLVVTKLIGWVNSGGSVAIQVSWDANNEDATPTNLNTSAPTITSSTTGNSDTAFDNAEIPPQRWVWLTTPTVTTQPTKLRVTLIGYVRNLSY